MSKDQKLRRYRRKDYTEVVDFPVEIVGRDGMVRRYDFEASIQLYQRRMHFAALRFHDADLVTAERGHCRARIEQLRRSFFHLHGWGSPDGTHGPEGEGLQLAGELAGFLMRVLRATDRLDTRFTRLKDAHPRASVWFVDSDHAPGSLLVYAFDFRDHDSADPDAIDEDQQRAYHALVASLSRPDVASGDAERLVANHLVADWGFVLSGRAEDVVSLAAAAPDANAPSEVAPTPWDEVRDLVRRGDFPSAFLRCRWVLEGQPWHREAYAVGAMLGLVLRRPSDAEDLAFMGTRTFPRDGLLAYYLGLARLHQQRLGAASEAFRAALAIDEGLVVARTALALTELEQGRILGAMWVARLPRPVEPSVESNQHAGFVGLVARMIGFGVVGMLALAVTGLAVAELGRGALVFLFVVIGLVLMGAGVFRERLSRLADRIRDEDLQLAMRRVQKRRTDPTHG